MRSYAFYNAVTYTERLHRAVRDAHVYIGTALQEFGTQNGKGDYLDIATDGKISWRPLNRAVNVEVGEDPYAPIGRQRAKPARALKSFLPSDVVGDFNDTDWEVFSNRFLAAEDTSVGELQIVDGKDIKKFYLEDNYTITKRVPQLTSSCMRYDWCQPFLDLYSENKDKVRMVVELDLYGKVMARALVWNFDSGETFMDRIYGDDRAIERFRKYAEGEGWLYRSRNTYSYPTYMMVEGESRRRNKRVSLEHVPEKFPFCDTMLWIALDDGILANSKTMLKGKSNVAELRHTHGHAIRY